MELLFGEVGFVGDMEDHFRIRNKSDEQIDVLVEGNPNAETTVVFVHGFGTDRNEGYNIFVDMSEALQGKFRIVRFDFPGYGKSGGRQEDVDYNKQARDLETILNWVRKIYGDKISIVAHSMGTFVVSLLSPENIGKTIFSAIPNANTDYLISFLQNRINSKPGGVVDKDGISLYPRSSGEMQKVGLSFWKVLRAFDLAKAVADYAKRSNLLIIHPLQDEIVGNKHLDAYKVIPETEYMELDGDHNYSKRKDREGVIEIIQKFLE